MPYALDSFRNIPEAFFTLVAQLPERTVYRQALVHPKADLHDLPRARRSASAREVRERVRKIAHYLRSCGFQPGDRAAIISSTRPEWMEADLGILAAGGVVVSVYPSLTSEEIGYILFDSGAKFVFVENDEQFTKLLHLISHGCVAPAVEDRAQVTVQVSLERIITFEEGQAHDLVETLHEILEKDVTLNVESFEQQTRNDLACLVYTSGTTGPPKGVMQTHGNHLSNVRQAFQSKIYNEHSCIALFLPLAHSFAKLMGYVGFLTTVQLEFPAIVDAHASKPVQDSIARDLREGQASVVPVVPRLLEKMQEGVLKHIRSSGLKPRLLQMAVWSAQSRFKAKKEKSNASIFVWVSWLLTIPFRAKIKARLFGKAFEYAISGGAKLQPVVNEFFQALGIEVLEGYGLTETSVATNVNRVDSKKIGSVGPVLAPDIEMKIAADQEILFRGPNIALGYFNRPTATKEAWDSDGWFHTGDLGSVDSDGFLWIVGRKKELVVTSGGKKISPDAIEHLLKESPLISQAMLVGDEKPYCGALLTLDLHAVESWAKKQGLQVSGAFDSNSKIFNAVWSHVQKVNETLASFETVKRIKILPEEFTVENGLLTPTMKVKRKEVKKRFEREIEQLFS